MWDSVISLFSGDSASIPESEASFGESHATGPLNDTNIFQFGHISMENSIAALSASRFLNFGSSGLFQSLSAVAGSSNSVTVGSKIRQFVSAFTTIPRSQILWNAMTNGLSLSEKIDTVINVSLNFYDYFQLFALALGKLTVFLLLMWYTNWRIAFGFWLLSNVIGTVLIYRIFFGIFWFLLTNLFVDSWFSSLIILTVWSLHELNLISVPRITRYVRTTVFNGMHRLLDVTGDGKFDYEDVEVLARRTVNAVRSLSPCGKGTSDFLRKIRAANLEKSEIRTENTLTNSELQSSSSDLSDLSTSSTSQKNSTRKNRRKKNQNKIQNINQNDNLCKDKDHKLKNNSINHKSLVEGSSSSSSSMLISESSALNSSEGGTASTSPTESINLSETNMSRLSSKV